MGVPKNDKFHYILFLILSALTYIQMYFNQQLYILTIFYIQI